MIKVEENKLYLITGGSGFLSDKLIEKLLSLNAQVRIVARNEGKLIEVHQKYPQIEFITGDVSEYSVCLQAMKGKR